MTPTCNTHDWTTAGDGFACRDCPATSPACLHGRKPHPTRTALRRVCERCLERGRRLVQDVIDDRAKFPDVQVELMGLRGVAYDLSTVRAVSDDSRLPFGMDRLVDDLDQDGLSGVRRVDTAVGLLHEWAAAWAALHREDVGADPLGYLVSHTLWAMENPAASEWENYQRAARSVRACVRRLLGIQPVKESTPCPRCGGQLVRDWLPRVDATPARESSSVPVREGRDDEGLDDRVRCGRCRASWPTPEHLHLAALTAIDRAPEDHPDAVVTFAEMLSLFSGKTPAKTIRSWVYRGKLKPTLASMEGSQRMFRLADIHTLVAQGVTA